jgi:hypothetical protein
MKYFRRATIGMRQPSKQEQQQQMNICGASGARTTKILQ